MLANRSGYGARAKYGAYLGPDGAFVEGRFCRLG